jgi:hypothetical protein
VIASIFENIVILVLSTPTSPSSTTDIKNDVRGEKMIGNPTIVIKKLSILTFPVKSKIQQCKLLEALSGKGLRNDSLDRKKNILKPSSRLSFKFQKQRMKGV